MSRMARHIRLLRYYIPRAMEAFQTLRRKEVEALADLQNNPRTSTSSDTEIRGRVRLRVIERMKSDDSF